MGWGGGVGRNFIILYQNPQNGTIIVLTVTFVLVIMDEVFTSTLLIIHAFCWFFGYK